MKQILQIIETIWSRPRIHRLIEKAAHGKSASKVFDYFIITIILLSVVTIILETIPDINAKYRGILSAFNLFSIIIFSIEYLLRLYTAEITHPASSKLKSLLKFIFSFQGLIDLIAIIPFYLPMLITIDMRFMRVLRLIRFLRILKINRYDSSLKLIAQVVKEKKPDLLITAFLSLLVIIISSFLIYHAESQQQTRQFPNILTVLWWTIATLTTVGYDEIHPVTSIGRIISSLISIVGIGIIALPTGIISAGFIDKIQQKKHSHKCPHCGKKLPKSSSDT